ncbi:putative GNAT family N-acyltransferase [Streptococcus loxodontisalivarius]|uniref:GNAT family N-acyltransferase n=2 Tax=Streptococcus loxodontisalivarius TaxID=1349415 RepID=A0ABS2PR40_9STRE|nr:putative GNAT family N-acyltransferase [Streptococcus loxodontisalivarius]
MSKTYLHAMKIRHQVFVKGQGIPRSRDLDKDEANCLHFVLYDDNNQAAATCRLLFSQTEKSASLQRMAVLDKYQGHGLGNQLLQYVCDFAKERQIRSIKAHSQLSALPFYQKNGFIPQGETFLDTGIEHLLVIKKLS